MLALVATYYKSFRNRKNVGKQYIKLRSVMVVGGVGG